MHLVKKYELDLLRVYHALTETMAVFPVHSKICHCFNSFLSTISIINNIMWCKAEHASWLTKCSMIFISKNTFCVWIKVLFSYLKSSCLVISFYEVRIDVSRYETMCGKICLNWRTLDFIFKLQPKIWLLFCKVYSDSCWGTCFSWVPKALWCIHVLWSPKLVNESKLMKILIGSGSICEKRKKCNVLLETSILFTSAMGE